MRPAKTALRGTVLAAVVAPALMLAASPAARAHFQELIPSTDIVTPEAGRTVTLDMVFTHPMDGGPVMEMGAPARFGVVVNGETQDLTDSLEPMEIDGSTAYRASYDIRGPGDHVFFIEPAPYWEPAEQVHIIHYTKVVVEAFGAEEGWDALVGLPVEIAPLVRPYGLWTGNLFSGIVLRDGAPVPYAEVEVEYRNSDGDVTPPADPFITQVIKADANGVFSYAMPRAGWWGFAALLEGEAEMETPEGTPAGVELGALMWVRVTDME